jgi:hypothetical protein
VSKLSSFAVLRAFDGTLRYKKETKGFPSFDPEVMYCNRRMGTREATIWAKYSLSIRKNLERLCKVIFQKSFPVRKREKLHIKYCFSYMYICSSDLSTVSLI